MIDPKDRNYLAAADLLRVFSMGLVAWFHIWQQSWLDPGFHIAGAYVDLQRIIRRGYMAVDLLLLLSGFLLYWPVARAARRGLPPEPPLTFYKKRLWRILPGYLVAVLGAFAFALYYGREPGSAPLGADLLAHLTFTQTFWRGTYQWTSCNVVLWTLAVEMQFYLLFPLAARMFRRRPWLTWAGMTVLALLSRWSAALWAEDLGMVFNQLPCMLDLYAFGMLSAHLLAAREGSRPHWLYSLGSAVCLAGILRVLWVQDPVDERALNLAQMNWRLPLAALGGLYLWCGGQWTGAVSRAVGNRATRYLSLISYEFYIWHQYLAVKLKLWHIPPYVTDMPQRDEGLAWRRSYTLLCFLAAFAAAAALTWAVEKITARLRNWRKMAKLDNSVLL